jgi:hypothetical protein
VRQVADEGNDRANSNTDLRGEQRNHPFHHIEFELNELRPTHSFVAKVSSSFSSTAPSASVCASLPWRHGAIFQGFAVFGGFDGVHGNSMRRPPPNASDTL